MSTTPGERQSEPLLTPARSSASVQVFWLNRPETLKRLQKAVTNLTDRHPEIEQVVLFGSLARGDAVPGSDADLLVILRESELPFLERCVHYRPAGVGVGVDVFAYTETELGTMLAEGNTFVTQALREGITIFGEEPARAKEHWET